MKFLGPLESYPARTLLIWYAALIVLGTVLLLLPIAHEADAAPFRFSDACFTATSAACVTGLIVRSTPHDFSFFGEAVILLLIQLGGIGIMTVASLVGIMLGGGASLRERAATAETYGSDVGESATRVVLRVLGVTFAFEAVGVAVLMGARGWNGASWQDLWWSVFHSVSAFCNAGFALMDDSLIPFADNTIVVVTMAVLIIVGGFGFPVLWNLWYCSRQSPGNWWRELSFHSKLILVGSFALVSLGTVFIWIIEYNDAFVAAPGRGMLHAFFQSVTARTAGFNTLPLNELTNASLFIVIVLMFIGGGPSSTAGGIKVSTMMVLLIEAEAVLRGHRNISLFRRSIATDVAVKAITTALLYGVVAIVGLSLILYFEESHMAHAASDRMFMDALFEVISALGTVGLSLGFTEELSEASRWVVMALMFIGRVGPLALVVLLSSTLEAPKLKYPRGEVLIG